MTSDVVVVTFQVVWGVGGGRANGEEKIGRFRDSSVVVGFDCALEHVPENHALQSSPPPRLTA